MKTLMFFLVGLIGIGMGSFYTDYRFRTDFEALTNINWYSFQAAHDDCVNKTKEQCKIFGGFAPKSAFAD